LGRRGLLDRKRKEEGAGQETEINLSSSKANETAPPSKKDHCGSADPMFLL